ncbi:hypothetical protein E2562_015909 [Oryza meyeriana var. granulata]|uniref:Uncharacterized protein n=1 Tax=Oryza meyeriana var. granulata TaxID=110450 RepID=A0A6G1CGE6_9ORYZ|nr:hypothetical protein E2562_015909 [Oryza meyeriana var. granulata]
MAHTFIAGEEAGIWRAEQGGCRQRVQGVGGRLLVTDCSKGGGGQTAADVSDPLDQGAGDRPRGSGRRLAEEAGG